VSGLSSGDRRIMVRRRGHSGARSRQGGPKVAGGVDHRHDQPYLAFSPLRDERSKGQYRDGPRRRSASASRAEAPDGGPREKFERLS
jgi:hypothetical protein